MAENLKIIPLGGLNEIGKNMTVYEYGGEIIVVDCGMAFPGDDMYGIDLRHPRRELSCQAQEPHPRHVHHPRARGPHRRRALRPQKGQYAHLLHAPDRGPHPLKARRARPSQIDEDRHGGKRHDRQGRQVQRGVHPREPLHRGQLWRSPSTPGSAPSSTRATSRSTPRPSTARSSTSRASASLGKQGVLALLADSTNVERPGYTMSERTVGKTFDRLFAGLQAAHHRHDLRLQRPPHPAGHRRGGGGAAARSPSRAAAWKMSPRSRSISAT